MKQDNLTSILFLFILLFGIIPCAPASTNGIDSLSGRIERLISSNWQFRELNADGWHAATVPGCVHTDLLANKLIPDPFFGANEQTLQWIERKDWEYRTVFEVDDGLLQKPRHEIVFTGLDTYCDVYLNGKLLLQANNMFRQWRCDCSGLLKQGKNTLRVLFQSPVIKAGTPKRQFGYKLPGGPRVLTRKAAYHYGWDWGPRFVTSGIWRPVYLVGWGKARIQDIYIKQDRVTTKEASVIAQCRVESLLAQQAKLSIQFVSPSKKMFTGSGTFNVSPGSNTIRVNINIPAPELWWANGLGKANLYDVSMRLSVNGKALDERSLQVGLRSLRLVREKDRKGTGFYFLLNGIPVFAKGANYIPLDSFVPRVTEERYVRLLSDAAEAGMNMLRVWGGGIYENDVFYDVCDRLGILVWQDFMFANGMYPGDTAFFDNVKYEAIDNIKRLRNHPSIALWCGNNEIEEAWHNWGWRQFDKYSDKQREKIRRDYLTLFHKILPELVSAYDSGRQYWPSSPKFGRADSRSLTEGDAHYWGVWHDGEPFENFVVKVGRFMSEYGFQSFPEMRSILEFAGDESLEAQSPVMLAHQKHPRGNSLIQTYMKKYYPPAKDFPSFVYLSQVLQAEGIKVALEAHRRARPYCMGTLYWQLNDCWPVASWSSIDYHGRWKALHYYAKKAFQPFLVSPIVHGEKVEVIIVSDEINQHPGRLDLKLWNFSGKLLWKKTVDISIPAGSSTCFFSIPEKELIQQSDRRNIVLEAIVSVGGERVASNFLYFLPPKELVLPRSRISAQASGAGDEYSVLISTDKLARNVYLEMVGVNGRFSDNYFDLLPGRDVRLTFITQETLKPQKTKIKITSLVDCIER